MCKQKKIETGSREEKGSNIVTEVLAYFNLLFCTHMHDAQMHDKRGEDSKEEDFVEDRKMHLLFACHQVPKIKMGHKRRKEVCHFPPKT